MTDPALPDRVAVDLDAGGNGVAPIPIGWLHRARAALSFEYEPAWLSSPDFMLLDPALGHYPGPQYPVARRESFGLLEDASPDRWGRVLMQRREHLRAHAQGRRPRTLTAWDYLLGVNDETRMGALRLRDPDSGDYLDQGREPVPPVTALRTLEAASRDMEVAVDAGDLEAMDHWLRVLVAPGSSLGGARPKCSFRMTDGSLWIAKFPARDDDRDIGLWERVGMRLAVTAGIATARNGLRAFGRRHHTFCAQRFDRARGCRIPFVSAMNFAQKIDGDPAGYLDIVQALDDHGTFDVKRELEQLFRRVVFNILTANRDDHLRNHGFLVGPEGIRLAPAYDINPMPDRPEHALAIDEESAAPDVALALDTAGLYGLDRKRAERILREVRAALEPWRAMARESGASRAEILFMEPAFRPDNR